MSAQGSPDDPLLLAIDECRVVSNTAYDLLSLGGAAGRMGNLPLSEELFETARLLEVAAKTVVTHIEHSIHERCRVAEQSTRNMMGAFLEAATAVPSAEGEGEQDGESETADEAANAR